MAPVNKNTARRDSTQVKRYFSRSGYALPEAPSPLYKQGPRIWLCQSQAQRPPRGAMTHT